MQVGCHFEFVELELELENLGKNEGDLMRVVYIGVKDFYEFKKFLFWKLKTLQDKCLNYQLNTNANIFGKIIPKVYQKTLEPIYKLEVFMKNNTMNYLAKKIFKGTYCESDECKFNITKAKKYVTENIDKLFICQNDAGIYII